MNKAIVAPKAIMEQRMMRNIMILSRGGEANSSSNDWEEEKKSTFEKKGKTIEIVSQILQGVNCLKKQYKRILLHIHCTSKCDKRCLLYGRYLVQTHWQSNKGHGPLCCSTAVGHLNCYTARSHSKSKERELRVYHPNCPMLSGPFEELTGMPKSGPGYTVFKYRVWLLKSKSTCFMLTSEKPWVC